MENVLIYARVSTEDQVDRYGLSAQLRACREYATARGWQIAEEISDDGISGAILERRGLDRMRQLVRDGCAPIVLMLDADRLSRELAHLLILKPEIEKRARLHFVTGSFEDSPTGRLYFSMRGSIAQYERELIRERTMRGKRERAREGLIVGGRVAYGYLYKAGRLIPDEARAATVRKIFACCDAGESLRSITAQLRSNGVPTWSGRKWGHSSVQRILTNETYAGVAHYGTHRREGKVLHVRLNAERIALTVPALVSREVWERVQARLAAGIDRRGRPGSAFLLRGLLYCAACGRRMVGEGGRSNAYRCSGRDALRHEGEQCRASVLTRGADAAVWAKLVETFSDAEVIRAAVERNAEDLRGDLDTTEELRARLKKLQAREEAALNALLDPDLAPARALLKTRWRQAQQERTTVAAELARIERRSGFSSAPDWIERTVVELRVYLAGVLDASERQQIARRLIERAEWTGSEVRMSCFISSELAQSSGHIPQFERLSFVVHARLAA